MTKANRTAVRLFVIFIMIAIAFLFIPENQPAFAKLNYKGPYKVTRVVDGDTLVVKIKGNNTKVRMIGVDTPESVSPDESRNTEEGKIASKYTKKKLNKKKIYLVYDKGKKDKYGRTLAYVFTCKKKNGKKVYTDYNAKLLKIGYARTMFVYPNYKFKKKYLKLEKEAQKNHKGFWYPDGTNPWGVDVE